MKPIQSAIIAAAALMGYASAQTATTVPVGYITHTIAPSVTGQYASADTYISPSLTEPIKFAAQSTSSPSGSAIIEFTGSVPALTPNLDVLEITEGPNEGWWSTVVSSDADSITVLDAFPASLPANTKISVRRHTTVLSFLGNDNNPGFIPFDGVNPNDEIQLLNAESQVALSIGWISGPDLDDPAFPDGAWFETSNSVVANDFIIEPGQSVLIRSVGENQITFTSTGTVKTTDTQVDIYPNYNWIGTQLAVGGTFQQMGFINSFNVWDGENPNYDSIQLVRADQTASEFAVYDDNGLVILQTSDSEPSNDEPFSEGTGAVVVRTGLPESIITIPGTIVGN